MLLVVSNLPLNAGDIGDMSSIHGWGRSPVERHGQPTPVFLPGESVDRGAWWAPESHRESNWSDLALTHTCIMSEWVNASCSVMSNSCNLIDWSPPGFSVHGILQARILEWAAISFSHASYNPAIPLLIIFPKETKTLIQQNIYTLCS